MAHGTYTQSNESGLPEQYVIEGTMNMTCCDTISNCRIDNTDHIILLYMILSSGPHQHSGGKDNASCMLMRYDSEPDGIGDVNMRAEVVWRESPLFGPRKSHLSHLRFFHT